MISFKLKKVNNSQFSDWLPGAAAGSFQQLLSQKDPGERELGGQDSPVEIRSEEEGE